ncbi:hypothetical protein HBI66_178740 [Parastagonospora nodorum]|nr:hypothetical protein HBI66_178740 [Parastagonospora nodorum]
MVWDCEVFPWCQKLVGYVPVWGETRGLIRASLRHKRASVYKFQSVVWLQFRETHRGEHYSQSTAMDDKISTDRHAQIVRNQGEDIYARCMSAAKKRKFLTIGGRRMCCFQSESG